jgi:hypothetical protein
MKRLLTILLVLSTAACGSGNSNNGAPTAPTVPTVPTVPTSSRIINVSGDLNFGQVTVGDAQTRFMTIANSGTSTLTISGITGPAVALFP